MKHFKNIQNLTDYYNVDSKHPLIDIRKYEEAKSVKVIKNEPVIYDFYQISFVNNFNGYIQIGNNKFEGENGILYFIEPGQVYTCNSTNPWTGYQILIHPDIFKDYFTYKKISAYDFFSYDRNESLLLNKEEKSQIKHLLDRAWFEFQNINDNFSIAIVLSYIGTLLNLSERFYNRQFDTRKQMGNRLSKDFFILLNNYYRQDTDTEIQQPTVQFFADKLHVTPNYLSDTIKYNTGKSALTIIHDLIIDFAKNRLTTSLKTISEISYELGFEYPNYFSRLFKQKTGFSPTEYRKSVKSI